VDCHWEVYFECFGCFVLRADAGLAGGEVEFVLCGHRVLRGMPNLGLGAGVVGFEGGIVDGVVEGVSGGW
jgi:hypothetical protein